MYINTNKSFKTTLSRAIFYIITCKLVKEFIVQFSATYLMQISRVTLYLRIRFD